MQDHSVNVNESAWDHRKMHPLWMSLDNAGKIYPAARSRRWTPMFRLSVTLTEDVDPEILAQAEARALRRFPTFACCLRRGLFWYYMEHTGKEAVPEKDVRNPMVRMKMSGERPFLFRVRYFNRRIAVELFHALTDGSGALTFLLTLTGEYLRIRHGIRIPASKFVLSCDDAPTEDEMGDSFRKFAGGATLSRKEPSAYHMPGTPAERHRLLLITGVMPTEALAGKAKEYNVSVNVLLTSLLVQAIHQIQIREPSRRKRRMPVKVSVPVDLRRIYPTGTVRNFSSYVNLGINSALGTFSFPEILAQVQSGSAMHITEKSLNARFTLNVRAERNPVIRAMPLFLKNPVMKAMHYLHGERYFSSVLSNIGLIRLPDEMAGCVERMDMQLGSPDRISSVCACISCGGRTVITFSRKIVEAEYERLFFTSLIKMGIPVRIESNRREW